MTKQNTRPPTSHIAPFGIRMQPELKERLEDAAQQAGRSLNAEIVARLESSFSAPEHAVLLSAFSRLEYALAKVEMEKVSERAKTMMFAANLRDVCERLLPIAGDPKTEQELREWIAEASGVLHGVSELEAEFKKRLDKLGQSISKLEPLAPGVTPIGADNPPPTPPIAKRIHRKPPTN